MAFRRLGFAALVASIFAGTYSAAFADSVFLLQLGSFPSESEANQRWNDLKSKHSDILSGLALRIAQVALPPDNAVIYRTQAGPIESREDAAAMCKKLAGTKDECFVVETAMFIGDQDTAAIAPPKAVTTAAPAPAAEPSAQAASEPLALPSALPAEPAAQQVASNSAPLALPPAALAEIPPATPPVPTPPAAEPPPPPAPIAQAPQPLPEPVELVTESAPPPAPVAEASEQKAEAKAVSAPAPKVAAKSSAKSRQSKARDYRPGLENNAARGNRGGYLPDMTNQPSPAPAAVQPAPAFLLAQNAGLQNNAPRELVEAPADASSPASVSVRPIENVAGNRGVEVNVAEAIRVPLSGAQQPAPRLETREPGVGGYPSYSPNFRTLWAQVNYFNDQQSALAFWDEYRYKNPDATRAVRVRVTQPYYFARSGRVSLRMGPFAEMDDVRNVCAAASGRNMTCSMVKDTGSSASANSPRDRSLPYRGYEENRHLQSWNMAPDAPANWVQLGSYPTPEQAWNAWERYKGDHRDLIGKMGADVNTANMSSAASQVFRLRVGPFVTKMAARRLCDSLENRGVSCVVVSKR